MVPEYFQFIIQLIGGLYIADMAIDFTHPWPFLATATFVALLGFYAWKQPRRPGARYFGWMIVVWLIWALAAGFATTASTPELHFALWAVQNICALLTSLLAVMFALEYTGNEDWLARRRTVLLVLPALIFALLAIFLPSTALVTIEVRSGIPVILTKDITLWAPFVAYTVIWLISAAIYLRCLVRAPAFQAPILWILTGQILPPLVYLALKPQQSSMPPMQAAILFSNFTALTLFVALFQFRILEITPVARVTAMDQMPYGMIVLDAKNRLVDFNSAAQALPRMPDPLRLRLPGDQTLGDWWGRLSGMIRSEKNSQTHLFKTNTGQRHFNVHSFPLLQPSGWRIGQVFLIEDITQIRQAQRKQAHMMWTQATLQEREQLAHELHDGLSQSLAFLNLQSQTAQLYLQSGQQNAALECVIRLTDAAEQVQEEARGLIANLLAVNLQDADINEALCQVVTRFQEQTDLMVHLNLNGQSAAEQDAVVDLTVLPSSITVQLLRIIQEALTNIYKHALDANEVSLKFEVKKAQVDLVIEDDGEGFDPSILQNNGHHFGLRVMRQRAERLGGNLSLDSRPGAGTKIQISVPLTNDEQRGEHHANPAG